MSKEQTSAKRRPGVKRVQKRDRDATQLALIEAGEALFSRHGFSGVTLDMLAKKSGVNKALVSYYFGSKEGLYDAVIAAIVSDVVGAVSASLIEGADPVRNFRSYIRALAHAFAARPSFPAILMREYIGGSMQEREGPFRQVLQFYRMTERLYEAGRKKKVFRKLDPHKLHLSIIGPLIHFSLTIEFRARTVARLSSDIGNPNVEEFSRHLESLILDGVKRAETSDTSGKSP